MVEILFSTTAVRYRMTFHETIKIIIRNGRMVGINTLSFQSLAVCLRTTRFNIQKLYMALALR
jgi:hypothetical protein